jgi:RimJ/RimL family protein N-acetyltransferase
MHIPSLDTSHTRLRPFTEADVDALYAIANQPDIFRYFPTKDAWSREKTARFIQNQLEHWDKYRFGWWGVEPRGDAELIGWNGLQYLPETREIEVGYLTSRSFWGQGWTTEGARASLQFGFSVMGIKSIIAIVHPENIASQRVALKCGMRLVDRTRYFGMECFRYRIAMDEFRRGFDS